MKSKRQAKAEKSQKLAKSAAKRAAAENSMETQRESKINDKRRKQIQFEQKQAEILENAEKNKKSNKIAKRDKNEKDPIHIAAKTNPEKENFESGVVGRQTVVDKPNTPESYELSPIHDVQRYLETLPSPEIRQFIEGLIAQDNFNMLTVDVVAAVADIDRMRYYFQKDPSTGKSRYDPNGRCLDGGTPLHTAIKAKQTDSIQLLIENGADLSLVDFMGDNAIMAAIKAGVANMINILWPYKANLDVNHLNTVGKTALHLATERSWEGCVRFLLSNQAIPDVRDRNGVSPLMIAAGKGDLKIVDILVKAGADICLEDDDYDTCISRALFGEKMEVLDHMLTSLNADRREFFVKNMMHNVINPPLPDSEYLMPETQYLPILVECTRHSSFRDSFYNQKVVQMIMVKMTNKVKQPDSVIQICGLLMCIFFRFGNEIDTQLVRQFVQSKGTDLVISLVQMYMCEGNFTARDALEIFLPLIGLVEIPEGRSWLHKNVLDVSEFFNHFERDILYVFFTRCEDFDWCVEKKYFKEINRVWIHFYNEVHKMQTEQREKHMLELLKEEEREKYKKEKRLEKIKQKKEDKIKKLDNKAASELLDSWSAKSILEEECRETEEKLSTCRNTNAIEGLTNELQNEPVNVIDNMTNLMNTFSQPHDNSHLAVFKGSNPNGNVMLDQFQRTNDEDWTTVQTKKNKEKERQTSENQTKLKQSPSNSLKRKNTALQKQKRKKDAKAKQVPLNAFSKPSATSSLGTARWADIAKGATKTSPHIEADDKSFPKPKTDTNFKDINEKSANETNETDFPSLNMQSNQTNKKEKPSTMIFHFHSNQLEGCESGRPVNESDDEAIDIEEAEKELQKLEEYTPTYTADANKFVSEQNDCATQSGECFMFDPEYIDSTKPNLFDPTKLTAECRSLTSVNANSEMKIKQASHESPGNNKSKAPNDALTNNDNWTKHTSLSKKDQDNTNLLAGIAKYFQEGKSLAYNNDHKINESSSAETTKQDNETEQLASHENNQIRNVIISKASKTTTKKKKTKKNAATISLTNTDNHLQDRSLQDGSNDQPRDSAPLKLSESSPVKAFLTEAEVQLLKNQSETFERFEEQLNLHESEHFIELVMSVSPIPEPKPNIIDDLFNSPEEIPEWLEDDEDVPNEEEVWENMTDHSTPIKHLDAQENEEIQKKQYSTGANFENLPTDNTDISDDIISSDPAIIHCSKGPDYVEMTDVNIACSMKKEYETAVFTNQQRNVIPPSIKQSKVPLDVHRDTAVNEIRGNIGYIDNKDASMDQTGVERQTAVIKPLGLLSCPPVPATNCAYGQSLLKTACRLEKAYDSDDSVLFPEDLAGESNKVDDDTRAIHESEDDAFYFPSFHADTKLSAHQNKDDVSVTHRMQQLQLEQLNNYYIQCKDQISNAASIDQSKFLYYAQSAGMDKDRIDQHLRGTIEIDQINKNRECNTRPVLPEKNEHSQQIAENKELIRDNKDSTSQMLQANVQDQVQYQQNKLPIQNVHQVPSTVQNGQTQGNIQQTNMSQSMTQQQVPLMPVVQFGVLVPFNPPPLHPANIKNIQSQQAAMSSTVRNKIQEILQSMFESKVKSVRWRSQLARIRSLPPDKLRVVGKIMIPRDENDMVYIGYHYSGPTVLGYLSDGSEVAVKIMGCKFRPLKQDEIDKLLSVDNSQLFINRYRAIEEINGYYFLAMDLYEYSLPEYLQIIKQDRNIDQKIAADKLVFQFLRAMLTLHQQYLIVHGELRPENIVIDTDGNLNVSGYGIGRNTVRDYGYVDYIEEDKCWLAPEVLLHNQTIVFKVDIWVIGMLIYYIYKGGKNPFGTEPRQIIQNIAEQNYQMEYISEEASHLLGLMLSVNKIERPAIADVLKHPLFWAEEKKIRFITIVGSDIVWEMRNNSLMDKKQRENSMTAIVSMSPCHISLIRWMQAIDPVVMKDMKSFRQYKNSLVELVVFVYNCSNHFETLSARVKEIIEEPCIYFLRKFPTLFMTVYRAIKFSNRRDKTCYKPFF